jgi:hypothetical protein
MHSDGELEIEIRVAPHILLHDEQMGAAWKIVVLRECAGAQASIRLARWLVGWLAGLVFPLQNTISPVAGCSPGARACSECLVAGHAVRGGDLPTRPPASALTRSRALSGCEIHFAIVQIDLHNRRQKGGGKNTQRGLQSERVRTHSLPPI